MFVLTDTFHKRLSRAALVSLIGGMTVCTGCIPNIHKAGVNAALSSPAAGHFVQVSIGYSFGCGLRDDGSVLCWGKPEEMINPPPGKYASISCGISYSCGVLVDGRAVCWGDVSHGQANPPPGRFTKVEAGYLVSCGIRTDGTAICWGAADFELGGMDSKIADISIGVEHICFTLEDGWTECLGRDALEEFQAPPYRMHSVGVGAYSVCGLRNDSGEIACWGYGMSEMQKSEAAKHAVSVESGDTSGMKLQHESPEHRARLNYARNLANINPTLMNRLIATSAQLGSALGKVYRKDIRNRVAVNAGLQNPPDGRYKQVSVGYQWACGLDTNGRVHCWGGCDKADDQCDPPPWNFKQIDTQDALAWFTCGVREDGRIGCWGIEGGDYGYVLTLP